MQTRVGATSERKLIAELEASCLAIGDLASERAGRSRACEAAGCTSGPPGDGSRCTRNRFINAEAIAEHVGQARKQQATARIRCALHRFILAWLASVHWSSLFRALRRFAALLPPTLLVALVSTRGSLGGVMSSQIRPPGASQYAPSRSRISISSEATTVAGGGRPLANGDGHRYPHTATENAPSQLRRPGQYSEL